MPQPTARISFTALWQVMCWPNQTPYELRGLGRAGMKRFLVSIRVRGSASGRTQKPILTEFGWETGGRPQRPKMPIQNALRWGMGLDGNRWASREAVTMGQA